MRRIAVFVVLALLTCSGALARSDVSGDRSPERGTTRASAAGPVVTTKRAAPPTYIACGAKTGDAISQAVDALVRKLQKIDAGATSLKDSSALAKAVPAFGKKRAKETARFLSCIEPLLGADPSSASAQAAGGIRLGPVGGRTLDAQSFTECLPAFTTTRGEIAAVYASNLQAIGQDSRFTAFTAAIVVITDLNSRIAGALEALFACAAGTAPPPASGATDACTESLLASVDDAAADLNASDTAIDASGASADQQALAHAEAQVAFERSLAQTTKAFVACVRKTRNGGGGSSRSAVQHPVPVPGPGLPGGPQPLPEPEPQAPTRDECRQIGASQLMATRELLKQRAISFALLYGGVIDEDDAEARAFQELALVHAYQADIEEILSVQQLCSAIAEAVYGPTGRPV